MTRAAHMASDDIDADDSDRCPCSSGDVFGACCGPLLRGVAAAPTAERLMRSRYSAFALEQADYLRATWHPSTRPASVDFEDDLRWRRLVVLGHEAGGPFDNTGIVEFEAHWGQGELRGSLHERSRFVREGRTWFYVDGDVQ